METQWVSAIVSIGVALVSATTVVVSTRSLVHSLKEFITKLESRMEQFDARERELVSRVVVLETWREASRAMTPVEGVPERETTGRFRAPTGPGKKQD